MGIRVTTGNFSESYNPFFDEGTKWDTSPARSLRIYNDNNKVIAEFADWLAVTVDEKATIATKKEPNG